MRVIFRCDGDDRLGAGHVARCLEVARAFVGAGHEALFCGTYAGVAAELLEREAMPSVPPGPGPAGVPDADAAVVDHYAIDAAEVESLNVRLPVAVVGDGRSVPRVTAVLSYHPGAPGRVVAPEGTRALLGAEFAPVRPETLAARRPRGLEHVLVTVGGGVTGAHLVDAAVEAVLHLTGADVFVAGATPSAELLERSGRRVRYGRVRGLDASIAWADAAVAGAGSTPYALACAGVPSVLAVVAENQVVVADDFAGLGLATSVDARGPGGSARLADAVRSLLDEDVRGRQAAQGPATFDGFGAFRARDALLAAFGGQPAPPVLRYRPAVSEDWRVLLELRNDPAVRAVSRQTGVIDAHAHRAWLDGVVADPTRLLFVVEDDRGVAGTLRFDRADGRAEISVTAAADRRGTGLGRRMIAEGSELVLAAFPELHEVMAQVRSDNPASRAAFAYAGYRETAEPPDVRGSVRLLYGRGAAPSRAVDPPADHADRSAPGGGRSVGDRRGAGDG